MEICETMRRKPEHVMSYLLAEMKTTGSLDCQKRLVVEGRFNSMNFQGYLQRYVDKYVICNLCETDFTKLSKEDRLLSVRFFVRCEECGCTRSVAPVKSSWFCGSY
ncbi:hypothetical protein MKW94_028278 [Papaver nudicaule]|uniref:Translation initiation factor IF2/IF5 domain-containing protein n=1 Tax=Papaver nudicaule TaxID=74823 RepID=A0AA41VQ75_PAPNU|nr:hypothetical protein [Papaver nudicaule]